ncbi:MAG TPA: DinB family protein [Candidatus Sulfotelmatobacter sp.]|nr:DinB family protein [Candidatus Sulfotelmatobacter sp.]
MSESDLRQALLQTYAINDAMNQLILSNLDPRAWRAQPPGKPGSGRTIAAMFAHLHNCRLVWIKHSAPHLRCPAALDPARCTLKQASAAHMKSAAQCLRMLTDALSDDPARQVTRFSRGAWAPVWPAGGIMFSYMFLHEAHHRGQIIMQAHQLGYRLPVHAAYGIWHWQKLWKQEGLPFPRATAVRTKATAARKSKS